MYLKHFILHQYFFLICLCVVSKSAKNTFKQSQSTIFKKLYLFDDLKEKKK